MKQHPGILYVGDNVVCRTVIKTFMELRLGLPDVIVLSSHDFEGCFDQLAPIPDLIFVDLYMEAMDAFEIIDLVHQNPRYIDVPVIALTTQSDQTTLAQLQLHGFSGCLTKPLNLNRLPHIMQQILDGEAIWMTNLEPCWETS